MTIEISTRRHLIFFKIRFTGLRFKFVNSTICVAVKSNEKHLIILRNFCSEIRECLIYLFFIRTTTFCSIVYCSNLVKIINLLLLIGNGHIFTPPIKVVSQSLFIKSTALHGFLT